MKIRSLISTGLIAIVFVAITNSAFAQISQQDAQKWLSSKVWNGGITLEADLSVNAVEFYKQYQNNKAVWEKVFAFLKTTNLDTISTGRHPIDGTNAYANVTFAPGKAIDDVKWESHRNYIDLHYVISGKEKIGLAPVSSATVTKPYDATSDGANYTADGTYHLETPGTFFLAFPTDAHRPGIKIDEEKIKKLVIKIKVVN